MFRRAPARRRLPRASRVLFSVVAVATLLELAGFGGGYLVYSRHYVSTDNAQVDGHQITITAPIAGSVTDLAVQPGVPVHRNEVIARIQPQGSGPQPHRPVRSPGDGTIAVTDVTEGAFITAGTPLAVAYDADGVYVTARVPDDQVGDVQPGARVDIRVDAYPSARMAGVVQFVQSSTAGVFTDLPPPGTADPSNPQRVDQYVPVRIGLTDTGGVPLAPGMNVSVHIHKG